VDFIVLDTGKEYDTLIPSIVSLCLNQIAPAMKNDVAFDVRETFYRLIFDLLLQHWNYFFVKNADQSRQIETLYLLEIIANSFASGEIQIFRTNLAALEHLNSTRVIYQQPLFINRIAYDIIKMFFEVLIAKAHNLYREEIISAIYNMVSPYFDVFFNTFLPMILENSKELIGAQKNQLARGFTRDTDLPTFTLNMNQFIADYSFFKQQNNIN